MGRIGSSCNGLLLINDPKIEGKLNVINFLTKCKAILPQCPSGCPHKKFGVALGFSPSTREYKVVHIYADGFGYEIFTLDCSDNSRSHMSGLLTLIHFTGVTLCQYMGRFCIGMLVRRNILFLWM